MRIRTSPAHQAPPLSALGAEPVSRLLETVDEAKAWAVIAALQQGYMLAEQLVLRLTPQTMTEAFLATPVGVLIYSALHAGDTKKAEELLSAQKQAALKAVRMNHDRITSLRTTLFDAAKVGRFPDGRAYSWTQWKSFAQDVADDLRAQVQYQAENTYLVNAVKFLGDLTITVVKIFDKAADIPTTPPSKWPWWLWGGAGLVGLTALAYTTNTFRALLPAPRGSR